ncbi:hypothetical protein GCM10011297_26640 [Bacterioplanes sanyensis]|uniref:GNAT family N-acetyltransferase n=1 Tax=Bacterioplanes sanyensis TaxID=1249553 RepID=UPI0016752BA4|nr:GNAT family N-acetyltransferase [Bacterioplanes sanyensis]GGY52407.1 hypothetical protein GCM10011297_26640 [Bacterioplanes sanyensis]
MNLIFRPATLNDIPALLQLEQAVVEAERPFNPQIKHSGAWYYDLPALIAQDDSLLLVAVHADQIIATGYVQIRATKPALTYRQHGYLGFMYVAEDFRGQGINQQLMQNLITWAQERGVSDFHLDVYAGNEAAIRAYEKAGFKPCLMQMTLHQE